jgi:hypothetical protein
MKKKAAFTSLISIITILAHSGCMEQTATHQNATDEEFIVNIPPTVTIQATPSKGMVPLTVFFTGISEDTDGLVTTYFWDFDDGTTSQKHNISHTFTKDGFYEVVLAATDDQKATTLARCTITVTPRPLDWSVILMGAQTKTITSHQFASYLEIYEKVTWEEEKNVWSGLPLWYLVAMVDDVESEGEYSFNDEKAQQGYTIKLTAGDGWVTNLKSYDVAHNNGYLVVHELNGEPLPKNTPRGKPSWPLHLRGSKVFPPDNIGNITALELIGLPEENSDATQPLRFVVRNLVQKFFPRWYTFFLDVKHFFTVHRNLAS